MTTSAHEVYAGTRRSLHGLAEVVLAGPRFRRTGDLRLRVGSGGFATWDEPTLAVVGTELVYDAGRVDLPGATYDDVARAAGLQASRLDDVYSDGPHIDPAETLQVDGPSAARLLSALAVGDEALRTLDADAERVLWPEHFDVGSTIIGVNYGVSPGDAYLPVPYAYVGPHHRTEGSFWNAPFGAAHPIDELGGTAEVAAFFREGATAAGASLDR